VIKLDSTLESVVVLCTSCPDWFAFAYSKDEGWKKGALHQAGVHPDEPQQARCAVENRRSRSLRKDQIFGR